MNFIVALIVVVFIAAFLHQFFRRLARRRGAMVNRLLCAVDPVKRIQYPHIQKAALLTVGGTQKPAVIRVDPDVVYISVDRTETDLAVIPMDQIIGVIYQDLSKEGYPMAGLGIVSNDGRYQFFSQRLFSPFDFQKTSDAIRESYRAVTGHSLPYSDPNEEILHTR